MLIYSKLTFAAEMCSFTGKTGVYNDILNAFVVTAKTWNTTLLPLVTRIFWGFFAAEFLYQLTFKKILSNDLSKLYVFFVIRIFTAYIFAYIFLNLNTYIGIIDFFTRIGAKVGGYNVDFGGTAAGMGISPSGLVNFLFCKFAAFFLVVSAAAAVPLIGGLQDYFGISLLISILFIQLIVVMFLVTMLDAYVVIFGGFILVGFSGSSWTQSYWQKYLSYAVGTGIRLFMTCLILGLVVTSFNNISFELNLTDILPPFLLAKAGGYLIDMLGVLVLSVYLLMTVPSKAASMLTGSMGGGMGELVGAASMLMAGGSMAKLAGGGAKGGAKALMEKLGGPGKNPSPSTLKSNTTTATQSAKSETAKAGKVEAMSKSMGQGEQPTPKPKFNDSLPDSGSTTALSSSASNPSSSSSGSTPAPSSSASSPSSSSSGSTPAPTSSTGSPSSSSSGSTPAPTSSASNPSSSSSGSTPAPSSSGGNSGSIGGGKGSTTPPPSTKAQLAKHGKSFADSVNKVSSGHAGAADININPHKE